MMLTPHQARPGINARPAFVRHRKATPGSVINGDVDGQDEREGTSEDDFESNRERALAGDTGPERDWLGGTALDSLTSHIVVLDEGGTILEVNQPWKEFARAHGADETAVSEGANYFRICDEAVGEGAEQAATFAAGVRDVLAGRSETFELGYACHAPDRQRWFIGRVTRLRDNGPPRVVVSHRDATGRMQAEEALRDSEGRFRQLAENIRDVFFMTDVQEFRVLYVSPAYEEIWGRTCQSLYDQSLSWLDGIHPDDRDTVFASLEQLKCGELWVKEYRLVRPDGSVRWIRARAFPIKDKSGNVYRIAGVAEDITERKRAEEIIAEQMRLAEYGRDVGLALTEQETLRGMLSHCAQMMVRHLDGAFARIWTTSEAGDVLELQASAGIYTHLDGPHSRVPFGHCKIGLIALERRQHVTNDVLGDPRVHDQEWARSEGLVAFAGYPLVVEDRVVGVMAMFARHSLSEAGVQVMASVANAIALGIERKQSEREIRRLNEHLTRRVHRMKALRRIDAAITSRADLKSTLALILEHAIAQLRVDAADVLLYDDASGMMEFAAGRGITSEGLGLDWPGTGGLGLRVAQDACPLYVPDLAHAPSPDARVRQLLAEKFVAYHAIPLMAKGCVKGVLECFHRARTEPDSEWLDFARSLAGEAAIAIDSAALIEGLRGSNEELRAAYDTTIEGWARALDLRDKDTEGHSRRVTEITLHLARAMGVGEADLVHMRRGALLHDIGKLGVPDAILQKPGPLTEAEWVAMRRHPTYAAEILGPVEFLGPALDIPHYHHERWDGTGYPCGLAGEQIPLAARIFATVDIWDALSNDRPYRRAWPQQRVREHIRSLAGNHLDPRVVEVFLGILAGEKLTPNGSLFRTARPPSDHPPGEPAGTG